MARFKKLDVPHQWKDEFTKYPHGYSIFESISKWVKLVNALITNINQWNEYLSGFTSTFGEVPQQMEELRQEMSVLVDTVNSDLTTIADEVTGLADTLLSHLTNYSSYLESELGEEHIIRSLPNGTKDEIRFTDNKLIKRVSNLVTIREPQIDSIITSLTYVEQIRVYPPEVGVWNGLAINNIQVYGMDSIAYADRDGLENIDKWTKVDVDPFIRFLVPKGTTLEQAKQQLAGTTLTYQLAEPILIPLPEQMTPNTREIVRLSEQVDKLINIL